MTNIKYDSENEELTYTDKGKVKRHHLENSLLIHDSEISCGVRQVEGLNMTVHQVRTRFKLRNKKQHALIFDAVLRGTLKKTMHDEEDNCAFFLFSTNIGKDARTKIIEKVLGNVAESTSRKRLNPNSGNGIRVWVVPRSNLYKL